MENHKSKIKSGILSTLNFGAKVILPNGISLNKTLNNEIIYEFNNDIKKISEKELRDILNDIKFWKMKNGRYIEINRMSTSHIINSINHQKKKIDLMYQNGFVDAEYENTVNESIEILRSVLRERNIQDILDEDENYGLYNIDTQ